MEELNIGFSIIARSVFVGMKQAVKEMKEILEAFSQIEKLDTSKAKPSFQPLPLKNVFRKDKAGKCFTQEQALSLAKHKKDEYFKGPRVVSE